jgi:hypothetical protein
MIPVDAITADLADEFRRGVRWLQEHGRPELTVAAAVSEALEDWIAELRAEYLGDRDIPTTPDRHRV